MKKKFKNFKEIKSFPTYKTGNDILDFCCQCSKKNKCRERKKLLEAMGENFPFWSKDFISFVFFLKKDFSFIEFKTVCIKFRSLQKKLPFVRTSYWLLELMRYREEKIDEIYMNYKETKEHIM